MTKDPLIFLVMVVGLYALIIATATTCDATQPRTVHHDVVVDTVRVYDTVQVFRLLDDRIDTLIVIDGVLKVDITPIDCPVIDTLYHIDGRTVFDIHKRWQQDR